MAEAGKKLKRVAIGILGGLVLGIGIVAIPYPGPGWLIVFTGLAILATEFAWAQKVLDFAKGKYDRWQDWLTHQKWWIRAVFWLLTAAVVITTLWLLNAYGMVIDWLGLNWEWLQSPLFGAKG